MSHHLVAALHKLGLTEKQAAIFLAVAKRKRATIVQISRDTGIERPTIYENAEILIRQNLVSRSIIKGKKYLLAEDPNNLYHLIEQKRVLARQVADELRALAPKEDVTKGAVKIYSGEEGAKKLTGAILHAKHKTVRTLGSYAENVSQLFTPRYLESFWTSRMRKHFVTHVLFPQSDRPHLEHNKQYTEIANARFNREVRLLPKAIDFHVLYTNVDDTVLFWSSKQEDFFLLYESEHYATSMRSLFDYLWNESERFR